MPISRCAHLVSREQVIERLRGLTLLAFEEVSVGVHRERSRRVPEAARDALRRPRTTVR